MYGYIYKTTNLITGRLYVGRRVGIVFKKSYYGSGLLIKQSVNKYGKNNFKVEILCTCDSEEELNKKEIYFIDVLDCIHPKGYNIAIGGRNCSPSKTTRRKISHKLKGRKLKKSTCIKMSIFQSNRVWDDSFRKAVSKGRIGIVFSSSHKKNLSIAQKRRFKNKKQRNNISIKNKRFWKKKRNDKEFMTKFSNSLSLARLKRSKLQ